MNRLSKSSKVLKNRAVLERLLTSPKFGTLGLLYGIKVGEKDKVFLGITLECYSNQGRNLPNTDCIPSGEYLVTWRFSPKYQRFTYRVIDVPKRSGILFHPANYAAYKPKYPKGLCDLQGCIAVGEQQAIGNPRNNPYPTRMITNSKTKTREFEDFFGHEDFYLIIDETHLEEYNGDF